MATVIGKEMRAATEEAGLVEARIVEAVEGVVRPDAVILCGSRATGEAGPTSDYDVLVVMPLRRVPSSLASLRDASLKLSQQLGVPVTFNPLPVFRLRRPGRSFLVYKAFIEGRILVARRIPSIRSSLLPSDMAAARSSYSVAAIRYLLNELHPEDLAASSLPPSVAHGVRKALLHVAQLELLSKGRYASRLSECLALVEGDIGARLSYLAERTEQPDTWFAVRELLFGTARITRPSIHRAVLENAQYAALSWLAGDRRAWRVVVCRQSIPFRLAKAAIALALAVEPGGAIDQAQVGAASGWVAPMWRSDARGSNRSWGDMRALVDAEWPNANPLLGL
jgi:predicted nucleotidyltransferase